MASGATLRRLIRARDLLHEDLRRGPSLDELAAEAGLSRAHLAREFASTFGVPPHQYLIGLRLAHAKRLLAAGDSVTQTCFETGLESLGAFSTTFRRMTGLSPRAWQQATRPFVQSRGVPSLQIPACFMNFYVKHV